MLLLLAVIGSIRIRIVDNRCKNRALQPAPDEAFIRTPAFCIIPAHNEEGVIYQTVRSILANEYKYKRVIVVADRCTDQTAALAKAAGAEVWERTEGAGGKQHALRWAFGRLLAEDATGFVLILDADNTLGPGALEAVAKALCRYDAVQIRILAQNPNTSVQAAWYAIQNAWSNAWQAGRTWLGRQAILGGTGVGVSLCTLRDVPWEVTSLVDDWEYTINLVKAGKRIGWVPWAWTSNENPDSWHNGIKQRLRWARGGYQVLKEWPAVAVKDLEFSWWLVFPLWNLYCFTRWAFGLRYWGTSRLILSVLVLLLPCYIQGGFNSSIGALFIPIGWLQSFFIHWWALFTAGRRHWYRTSHGEAR